MLGIRPVSRRNENAFALKTPGRMKNENAIRGTPMTGKIGGKKLDMKTPFKNAEGTGKKLNAPKTAYRLESRPFLDKTPFSNRILDQYQTPLLQQTLDLPEATPDSVLRPSSLRQHLKVPRPSLDKNTFQTPAPKEGSSHWDDGEIIPFPTPAVEPEVEPELEVEEDDDDEIEYMAPNNLDLEEEPYFGFEVPDFKMVGQKLVELAYSQNYGDEDEYVPEEVVVRPEDVEVVPWDMFNVPPVPDDDPFEPYRSSKPPAPKQKAQGKPSPLSSVTTVKKPIGTIPQRLATATTSKISRTNQPASATTTRPNRPLKQPLTSRSNPASTHARAPAIKSGLHKPTASSSSRIIGAQPAKKQAASAALHTNNAATSSTRSTKRPYAGGESLQTKRPATSASVYNRSAAQVSSKAGATVAPRANPRPPVKTAAVPIHNTAAPKRKQECTRDEEIDFDLTIYINEFEQDLDDDFMFNV